MQAHARQAVAGSERCCSTARKLFDLELRSNGARDPALTDDPTKVKCMKCWEVLEDLGYRKTPRLTLSAVHEFGKGRALAATCVLPENGDWLALDAHFGRKETHDDEEIHDAFRLGWTEGRAERARS